MTTQYVAGQSSSAGVVVSAGSQPWRSTPNLHHFHRFSRIFPQGYPQGCLPQEAGAIRRNAGRSRVEIRNRRRICPRASRVSAPCPCLPSWQHVAAQTTQVTLKSSWSSTPFRSRLNRPSPANTTKALNRQGFSRPVCFSRARMRGAA